MRLNSFNYSHPWEGVNGEFEVNWNLLGKLVDPKYLPMETKMSNNFTVHLRESVIDPKDLPMEVKMRNKLTVHKVIFHYPATIIYWKDGTKTVVKCGPDDEYDPEKGVALCFMKKALGNKGNYNYILKDALKSYKFENSCTNDISLTHPTPGVTKLSDLCEVMADAFRQSLGIKSPSKGDGTGDFNGAE